MVSSATSTTPALDRQRESEDIGGISSARQVDWSGSHHECALVSTRRLGKIRRQTDGQLRPQTTVRDQLEFRMCLNPAPLEAPTVTTPSTQRYEMEIHGVVRAVNFPLIEESLPGNLPDLPHTVLRGRRALRLGPKTHLLRDL